jgi:hypothetical protein
MEELFIQAARSAVLLIEAAAVLLENAETAAERAQTTVPPMVRTRELAADSVGS